MSNQIIDVRGGTDGPLLGRLRGVAARHEIRNVVMENEPIDFEVDDAHFAFRGEVPSPLPAVLTTSERQLVVSAALAAALQRLDRRVTLVPVRLIDRAGAAVDGDYAVAVVPTLVDGLVDTGSGMHDGYYRKEIRLKDEAPEQAPPPLFRLSYSLVIGCNADAAAVLKGFSGVPLVPFADYAETFAYPEALYLLWQCGTEGASFRLDDLKNDEALESNTALTTPRDGHVATMKMPKSRKKLVDFMDGGAAPIVSAKAKALLEKFDLVDVDFLPVSLLDHAGAPCKGEHFVLNVRCERPYVDVAESDIRVLHGLLWTVRELVVDEAALSDRPPLFRVPGARYPWVFVRTDVVEAITAAKLVGSRTRHPGKYNYVVEGGGIDSIC